MKKKNRKVIIPIAAVALLLAVFAGLWLFTDVFTPENRKPPVVSGGGSERDDGEGSGSNRDEDETPASASPTGTASASPTAPASASPAKPTKPKPTTDPPPPSPGTETPSPDTPAPGSEYVALSIGDIPIYGDSKFTFTPPDSGKWVFSTSDNGDSDPWIEILDENENYVAIDDDMGGNLNALIAVELAAGETYYIYVKFYTSGSEHCTLSVYPGLPGGELSAAEARGLAQLWLDNRQPFENNVLEPGHFFENAGGEEYYWFYFDQYDSMYWFGILVNMDTGGLLARLFYDGEDAGVEVESLDEWYSRFYG